MRMQLFLRSIIPLALWSLICLIGLIAIILIITLLQKWSFSPFIIILLNVMSNTTLSAYAAALNGMNISL